MSLKTSYMGIPLKNPIIIGSSGLTVNVSNLRRMEDNGAAAVVLKSVYEEQILHEEGLLPQSAAMYRNLYDYDEGKEYLDTYIKDHTLKDYFAFLENAKKSIKIPLFASINCFSAKGWLPFIDRIQDAGADGLEINIYFSPVDFTKTAADAENLYLETIQAALLRARIPISLKMGHNFPNLGAAVKKFSETGIKGLVLFNKPYSTDIDLTKMANSYPGIFTIPAEYMYSLRWGTILHGKLGCGMVATTGIHNFEAMLKLILAGYDAVQTASVFFKNDYNTIQEMIESMERWMMTKKYETISDFKGKLSIANADTLEMFERIEYMKLYTRYQIV